MIDGVSMRHSVGERDTRLLSGELLQLVCVVASTCARGIGQPLTQSSQPFSSPFPQNIYSLGLPHCSLIATFFLVYAVVAARYLSSCFSFAILSIYNTYYPYLSHHLERSTQ